MEIKIETRKRIHEYTEDVLVLPKSIAMALRGALIDYIMRKFPDREKDLGDISEISISTTKGYGYTFKVE